MITEWQRIKAHDRKFEKQELQLATWNVQGTNAAGALKNLAMVLENYNISIIALQETKQNDNSIKQIGNYIFFNSGDRDKVFGTGFFVHKNLKKAVISFQDVSKRIGVIRIRGKYRKISFINIHAPINTKELEEKQEFYEELASLYTKLPKYDIKINWRF